MVEIVIDTDEEQANDPVPSDDKLPDEPAEGEPDE